MSRALQFEIDGLSCASCVGRAEAALDALPGVDAVAINLATRTARVETDAASATDIRDALAHAGYPAREAVFDLDVSGLNCGGCVAKVEKLLADRPEVIAVRANLAAKTARVTTLAGATSGSDLARHLSAAGYPARPRQADAAPERDTDAQEARQTGRAALIAAILTLPVFVTEMGGHLYPPLHHALARTVGTETLWVLQFLLTTLVLVWPGQVFFRRGVPALLRGAPEMNSLVVLGASAAWAFSTVVLFLPALVPVAARAVYFEAAAVIVTLILVGRWLEARARGRTGAAVRGLLALAPPTAMVRRDGAFVEIPVDEIAIGDTLLIRPGARVPVDGRVTDGQGFVDMSMLTGEATPVDRAPGDPLVGGSVNGSTTLEMAAERVGADTALARIIAMVEEAQSARLPVQALADRIVAIFVPAVLAIAALTVLIWLVFGPDPALNHALVAGVAVLIIACPCAMGLATPVSIMVATGRAAEMGVLFRRGEALQHLSTIRAIAFDKTGTLTEGRPDLTRTAWMEGTDPAATMPYLLAAEARSEHPIAEAICRGIDHDASALPAVARFEAVSGSGLIAEVDGAEIVIGAPRLMDARSIAIPPPARETFDAAARSGETPVLAAMNGKVMAVFAVADRIKSDARDTVRALHNAGIKVGMLTGDAAPVAAHVAAALDIDIVEAELLPGDKVEAIDRLRAAHGAVAFVGDGINDAPALARADVGLAIGTGTDIAIEAGDVVLVSGRLQGVLNAHRVSVATLRNIRQNLFWAFAYNAALIPVAAGILYPAFGILLSPMLGAGAMALSSVFVVSNALRLRKLRPLDPTDPSRKTASGDTTTLRAPVTAS